MRDLACGLDFGTSNSTLGVVGANGVPQLVPLEGNNVAIPSALFFNFEDDATYFGRKAIAEYVSGADGRVMRALKSILGSALVKDETRIKARRIAFTEILGIFLTEMKGRAETHLGQSMRQVVAGRPVHFVDDDDVADRDAQGQLEDALRAQGFEHIEFQYEPIAAALDYEQQLQSERLVLVVDIGGGTSDFTLIRLSPERSRAVDRTEDILATAGVHIGGTDFDRLLSMACVMPLLGHGSGVKSGNRTVPVGPYFDLATWHRINRLYTRKMQAELVSTQREALEGDKLAKLVDIVEHRLGHLLATHVEEAKISLTDAALAALRFDTSTVSVQADISRSDFANAIAETVGRIHTTINETLGSAGVTFGDVGSLVMTGGSTQIPLIRVGLDAMFPQAERVEVDAFGSVGLGLALEARRRFGH